MASGEESRAPWRRRRPGRTGGLTAPPPHGGLPAPRGPLRREPHPSGPLDRAPGPGSRSRFRCQCATPTRSEPTNAGGRGLGGGSRRAIPAGCQPGDSVEVGTGPPAFPAPCPLTSQRGQRRREPAFRATGAMDGGWGRSFSGKISGIKGPPLGPLSLGRFRSGEYRAVSP